MQHFFTRLRMWILIIVATVGSAIGYWLHMRRAVGVDGLCQRVERHVAKLGQDDNGAISNEASGLVEDMLPLCEQRLSRSQAECVLHAGAIADVRGCLR